MTWVHFPAAPLMLFLPETPRAFDEDSTVIAKHVITEIFKKVRNLARKTGKSKRNERTVVDTEGNRQDVVHPDGAPAACAWSSTRLPLRPRLRRRKRERSCPRQHQGADRPLQGPEGPGVQDHVLGTQTQTKISAQAAKR